MSDLTFPSVNEMSLEDIRQMISALYKDAKGYRILVRYLDCSQALDISCESGVAVLTAAQEDGAIVDVHKAPIGTTWALKHNAYGRLMTKSDQVRLSELRLSMRITNRMTSRPRGRQQRIMGIQ